jgi:hypothetical protein
MRVQFKKIPYPEIVCNFFRDFPDTPFCPGETDLNKVRGVHGLKRLFSFPVGAARLNSWGRIPARKAVEIPRIMNS